VAAPPEREDPGPQVRRSRLVPPALRYPLYRRYWLGVLSSVAGYRMFQFAEFWLAHELTGSALFLGFVGLADAVPAIVLNLAGGAAADRIDKRRLIIATEVAGAGLMAFLGVLTAMDQVAPWHLLVIVGAVAGLNAFNQPARLALYPGYVGREALMGAVALNSAVWQGTRIVGPAVAGGVIAATGTDVALYASAVGMLGMALVMRTLPSPPAGSDRSRRALDDVVEGLRYIRGNSLFTFLIGMTFFNSFFGMAYVPLMPVFAVDILGVGVEGQGFLLTAGGLGSLLVTTWLGMRSSNRGRGLFLVSGATLTGSALVGFSLASLYIGSFGLSLALLFAVGAFSSMYMNSITTSLQLMVPDRLRGRVMGFWGMTWNLMPLGGTFAGGLSQLTGVPWAVAIGGFAVVGFALGPALLNPRVRRLGQIVEEMAHDEPAAPTREASTSGPDTLPPAT
jgi:MFS family permease